MKYLEIKKHETGLFDTTTLAGLYEYNGLLYFAPGKGLIPWCYPLTDFPFRETFDKPEQPKTSGISEDTLLKAIAISQKPELIRDI